MTDTLTHGDTSASSVATADALPDMDSSPSCTEEAIQRGFCGPYVNPRHALRVHTAAGPMRCPLDFMNVYYTLQARNLMSPSYTTSDVEVPVYGETCRFYMHLALVGPRVPRPGRSLSQIERVVSVIRKHIVELWPLGRAACTVLYYCTTDDDGTVPRRYRVVFPEIFALTDDIYQAQISIALVLAKECPAVVVDYGETSVYSSVYSYQRLPCTACVVRRDTTDPCRTCTGNGFVTGGGAFYPLVNVDGDGTYEYCEYTLFFEHLTRLSLHPTYVMPATPMAPSCRDVVVTGRCADSTTINRRRATVMLNLTPQLRLVLQNMFHKYPAPYQQYPLVVDIVLRSKTYLYVYVSGPGSTRCRYRPQDHHPGTTPSIYFSIKTQHSVLNNAVQCCMQPACKEISRRTPITYPIAWEIIRRLLACGVTSQSVTVARKKSKLN